MLPPYIFIDGSYFVFHRFHALKRWWKSAKPEEPLGEPIDNPLFVEKFKKTFVENIENIHKKLGIHKQTKTKPILVVGKDCKRKDIWRNTLYSGYKATRDQDENAQVVPFFRLAYDDHDGLFAKSGVQHIFSHPQLEADDCIAISVKHVLQNNKTSCIYILSGDHDYLQLVCENVNVFNLSYKKQPSLGNAKMDLFCKIVMGDKSDNIPSIFKTCGPKTAIKCFENLEFFKEKMEKENPLSKQQYELNQILIDFEKIPISLQEELYDTYIIKL
jgi:5'-3' exonuclease